jgi:hypothetical protein
VDGLGPEAGYLVVDVVLDAVARHRTHAAVPLRSGAGWSPLAVPFESNTGTGVPPELTRPQAGLMFWLRWNRLPGS